MSRAESAMIASPGALGSRTAADGTLTREVAVLRALQAIGAGHVLEPEEDIRACLDLVCNHVGLRVAVLTRGSSDGTFETLQTHGAPELPLPVARVWRELQAAPLGLVGDARVEGYASVLAVPVPIRDVRFGMLSLWGDPPTGGLTQGDLEVVRLVATHVGVSLDLKHRLARVVTALDDMADSPGEEVFGRLAARAATLQGVAYAVVTESPAPGCTRVRPRAIWYRGEALSPDEYALEGTPCAQVLGGNVVHHERDVAERFPRDARLAAIGAQSYLGVPMIGASGTVVGHVAVIDAEPMPKESGRVRLLHELARRAATCVARTRAEERLRASEERLGLAISTGRIIVWEADLERSEIHLNEHAKALVGREDGPDRIPLEPWPTMVHPEDVDHLAPLLIDPGGGDEFVFEHRVRHRDGCYRWVLSRIRVLERTHGHATRLVSAGVDVTERRRIEEQLRESQRLESLGVLAGGIAHDFNNLLMGILGNATLALRALPPESQARDRLRGIETAARRAAELTDQMLTYAGQGPVTIESVDLASVVGEMLRLLETVISKNATLEVHDRGAPPVDGDPSQIRQIVMNLITNASDALGESLGTITVTTGTMTPDEGFLADAAAADDLFAGELAYLEVRDSGHGMDDATRRRVFDPFFTTRFSGRGLGMAAVLGIIRSHHGAIRIQSQPGAGTAVTVVLPRAASAEPLPADTPAAQVALRGWGTVLVIDDESMVVELVRSALEGVGFEVVTAPDGPEGLRSFDEHRADLRLVVLDLTMPRMRGEDVLAAIRERASRLPVLLMSGHSVDSLTGRTRIPDGQPFLRKPFRIEALLEQVRAVLDDAEVRA